MLLLLLLLNKALAPPPTLLLLLLLNKTLAPPPPLPFDEFSPALVEEFKIPTSCSANKFHILFSNASCANALLEISKIVDNSKYTKLNFFIFANFNILKTL